MPSISPHDPFSKPFHTIPQSGVRSILPYLRKNCVAFDNGSCSGKIGYRINRGTGVGLRVRGCSEAHDNQGNDCRSRAFIAPRNQLVRELEDTVATTDRNSLYVNGYGTCQGGKPLGFPEYPLTEKAVVAVDVDEVLGNFVSALNKFIADRYSLIHSVSEYHVYEFFKIWNCSRDEADVRVHEFFKTTYFKSGIYPLPGAQKALDNLSRLCNLSVVTSRQNVIKDHTIDWIEKHYPGVFQEIHFGNHFALDGESKPKSEICRSLGATVLIDDNPKYALECAEVGIKVLLFDYEKSYPWCKTDSVDQHPLVTRVHNWEQVEQHLLPWIS
ncbi:Haloacid dehalogenase-like hydrolase (HAD) superfamily protein [Euphorbia peplus]|nr:Haloacid dehalogenase-like hydrolase (HAD) superfamily protein [Euphorbia peplus]